MAYINIARMLIKETPKLAKQISKSATPTAKKVASNLSEYIKNSSKGAKGMTPKTLKREVRRSKRSLSSMAKKQKNKITKK
tara:strand:+ start:671 stop:913 length:243 start_codon:yes stop_codon:yes gene_type:complete